MKKLVLLISSLLLCAAGTYSNDTLTNGSSDKILFVYEEPNEQISPWVELFKKTFAGQNRSVEYAASADVFKKDITSFSSVVIYGAVQAFTFKGPVRDWLKTDVNLAGKKVYLIVTASRWFTEDYFKQLKKELTKKNAETVNAVSAATAKMTDNDKSTFVNNFIASIR